MSANAWSYPTPAIDQEYCFRWRQACQVPGSTRRPRLAPVQRAQDEGHESSFGTTGCAASPGFHRANSAAEGNRMDNPASLAMRSNAARCSAAKGSLPVSSNPAVCGRDRHQIGDQHLGRGPRQGCSPSEASKVSIFAGSNVTVRSSRAVVGSLIVLGPRSGDRVEVIVGLDIVAGVLLRHGETRVVTQAGIAGDFDQHVFQAHRETARAFAHVGAPRHDLHRLGRGTGRRPPRPRGDARTQQTARATWWM